MTAGKPLVIDIYYGDEVQDFAQAKAFGIVCAGFMDDRMRDFLIRRDRENPFVVQASGMDSPGLTSCLAVGRLVSAIVEESV